MFQYIKIHITDAIAFCILLISLFFYLSNINYFSIPDSDIFQYISESKPYGELKLPRIIQLPPVNPMLIAMLSRVFTTQKYQEIFSMHIVNSLAVIGTLFFTYATVRRHSKPIGLVVMILLATNPLIIFSSLNINSEVLFTTLLLATIYYHQSGSGRISYVLACISFFIRYEGILLAISLYTVDILRRKFKVKYAILASIPIILWLGAISTRTQSGNLLGNGYIQEIFQHNDRIPQFKLLKDIPFLMTYTIHIESKGKDRIYSVIILTFIVIGLTAIVVYRVHEFITFFLFLILYIIFHSIFPFAPNRYLYPLLPLLYASPLLGLLLIYTKSRRIFRLISITVLFLSIIGSVKIIEGNLRNAKYYYSNEKEFWLPFPRYYRHEILLIADWVNKIKTSKPLLIITYEPWPFNYYVKNKNVSFFLSNSGVYQSCDSILCLMNNKNMSNSEYDIYVIKQSNSLFVNDGFPSASYFNVQIFNDFPNNEESKKFTTVDKISAHGTWAEIYKYNH